VSLAYHQRMANKQQRLFDALAEAEGDGLTIDQIAARARLERQSAINAINNLRLQRAVAASKALGDPAWRYHLRPGCERPSDGRGRRNGR